MVRRKSAARPRKSRTYFYKEIKIDHGLRESERGIKYGNILFDKTSIIVRFPNSFLYREWDMFIENSLCKYIFI